MTDTRGGLISANPKSFKLLKTNWQAIQNKRLHDLMRPKDRKKLTHNLSRTKKGEEVKPFEVKLLIKDQEPLPVEMSVSKVVEHKKSVALQFIIRDIRERIKLEKQLVQASKLSGLGELAAGVAHEINNPLAAISGCA